MKRLHYRPLRSLDDLPLSERLAFVRWVMGGKAPSWMAPPWTQEMSMAYTAMTDKSTGDLIDETEWDKIKTNFDWFAATSGGHDHSGDSGDGSPVPGTYVVAESTDVSIKNTATETNVFSETIPANTLGTTGILLVQGFYTYETDATFNDWTIRLKYGGTTIGTVSISDSYAPTSEAPGRIVGMLEAVGATNSQYGQLWSSDHGNGTGGDIMQEADDGTAAVDSTSDQTIIISVQNGAASADKGIVWRATVVQGAYSE